MTILTHGSALRRLQSTQIVGPGSAWKPPKTTPVDPDLPLFQARPVVMGSTRVYPRPLAKALLTSGPNGSKVVTVLKDLGRGPLQVSNLRLGDEVLVLDRLTRRAPTEFSVNGVTCRYELLEGRAGDEGLVLYPQIIGTQNVGSTVKVSSGFGEDSFTKHNTAKATSSIAISLYFPAGLSKRVNGKWVAATAKIGIARKPAGNTDWSRVDEQKVTGNDDDKPFTHTLDPITLATTASDAKEWKIGLQVQNANLPEVKWATLTSRGPKTLGSADGSAVLAVQGDLSTLGGSAYLPDLNVDAVAELAETVGGTPASTRNPSAAYLDILQGAGNPTPLADARIDSSTISAWKTFCADQGLTFDFVFGADGAAGTILDALKVVAAAGLARPIIRDGLYSVIREPSGDPVALFTPANMSPGFRVVRNAFDDTVHGIRCSIENRANAFRPETFIVYASGYSASNATKFEDWTFDGTTVKATAAGLAAYHLRVMAARALAYTFPTDWRHLRCLRGDLVRVAHPRVGKGLSWGWVMAAPSATTLLVNRPCPMSTGGSYGIRLQAADGTQTTKTVTTSPGEPTLLTTTAAHGASVGDHFAFGTLNDESLLCVVLKVAHGDRLAATLTVAPAGSGVGTGSGEARGGSTDSSSGSGMTGPAYESIANNARLRLHGSGGNA